jgi:hypothetical protein
MGGVNAGVASDNAQLRLLKIELSARELVPPVDEPLVEETLFEDDEFPPAALEEPPVADAVPTALALAALEDVAIAAACSWACSACCCVAVSGTNTGAGEGVGFGSGFGGFTGLHVWSSFSPLGQFHAWAANGRARAVRMIRVFMV